MCALCVLVVCRLSASDMKFNDVKNCIVIVQCDDSSGTGFVCEMEGRRYFVTNRHVVEDQTRVAAYFVDGKQLKFKSMEVAEDVDLVRFKVATNQPALKVRASDPEIGEKIHVFGNSDGEDVFTDLPGKIVGVGPGKIEVTSKFINGNSGSAVIDENHEVVGVATYAVSGCNTKDWIKQDTRFKDIRRFALRLANLRWVPCDLKIMNRRAQARKNDERKAAGITPEIVASFNNPSMRINRSTRAQHTEYFVNGVISLSMSGQRHVKNPVVRIAMLVDCNGQRYVFDRFATEPNGVYLRGNIPVYGYGMPSTGYSYDAGNGIYACFLEGISYYQPAFEVKCMKGTEYFDRSRLTTSGFLLPQEMTRRCDTAHQPKILAYRLECWQNGSLAGVYNSERPNTLNSRKIPVDWFIMHKYKRLFVYETK